MKLKLSLLLLVAMIVTVSHLFGQSPTIPPGGDVIDSNILTAMFKQVVNSPASLFVIAILSIVAWLVESAPFVSSKFIPHICVIGGASIYWLFCSAASVPKEFPHPAAVLAANGIVCGFVSFIVHGQIIMRLLKLGKPAAVVGAFLALSTAGCAINRPYVQREFDPITGNLTKETVKNTTLAIGDATQNIGKTGASTSKTGAKAGLEELQQQTTSELVVDLFKAGLEAGKKSVVPVP